MTPSLIETIALIERDLPGWEWLVRSNVQPEDPGDRFFANVVSPDFQQFIDPSKPGGIKMVGKTCPYYADAPEKALACAYAEAFDFVDNQERSA